MPEHPRVWDYTLREIVSLSDLRAARQRREDARALRIALMGTRGDVKAVREELRAVARER